MLAMTLAALSPAVLAQDSAPRPDPTGALTGSTTAEEAPGHYRVSINIVWTLITGFLVMFMQAGFAMVETGFTRAKNAAHTMSMNFMVYPIGMLGYWICGFALQMGGVGGVASLGGTPGLTHEFVFTLFGKSFGWFGFNPGSTLAGTDLRIAVVATNTMLASAGGAVAAMLYMMIRFGKPDPSMMANGLLAGLVAITAPCAFTNALWSVGIGVVAGLLVCVSVFFVEGRLKIDDPVGAISVHGVNGAWGCLALGLFSDGTYGDGWNGVTGTVKGLFYGDPSQLVAEAIGVLTCFVFVFSAFYLFFKVQDKLMGIRVSAETETEGLDLPEMGALAYPEFTLSGKS
jgi:ammonia channel protein AmtB